MSATPKYPSGGILKWGSLTAANTALDGTGTVLTLSPGAVPTRVKGVTVRHLGTNVATVARVFLNNNGVNSSAANNSLVAERTILANTLSQTAESIAYFIPLGIDGSGIIMPASYQILITLGTAVAAGLQFTLECEDLT